MSQIMRTLAFIVSVYMTVISVRIILTWFTGMGTGGLRDTLARITDPYLNWFKRFTFLRVGFLDLSPIAALGLLSVLHGILITIAAHGRISLGIILVLLIQTVWGAVSFFLGFLIIVLILRLIAHYLVKNSYNPFWTVVDSISRPVLFRINRVLFKDRILNFGTALIVSLAILVLASVLLGTAVFFVSGILAALPV